MDTDKISRAVADIIEAAGYDSSSTEFAQTPQRVADLYSKLLNNVDSENLFESVHTSEHNEMIIVKDIPFYALCKHHLMPFFGKCHFGYIPADGKLLGISKIRSFVKQMSKKLQLQEEFTTNMVETFMNELQPKGAAVVVTARHVCNEILEPQQHENEVVTSAVRGLFKDRDSTRAEFFSLVNEQ